MGTTAVGMVGQLTMVLRMAGNWIGGAGQWVAGGFV